MPRGLRRRVGIYPYAVAGVGPEMRPSVVIMIIWLNGTFGVGKTTTASLLQERWGDSRIFDPEHVGYMLSANFADIDFDDFQELPPWRQLVPSALKSVQDFTSANLIAPQSVLVQQYWTELASAMDSLELDFVHVLLDCDEPSLRTRIDSDTTQGPSEWRHDHVSRYLQARAWMMDAADVVVTTTDMAPGDVAGAIHAAVS